MSAGRDVSPRSSEVAYTCECGTPVTGTVHHAVNVTLEPQLLYRLLAGHLNVAVCPHCGRERVSNLPFVYHDMKRALFAYVYPAEDLPEEEREQLLERLRGVYADAVRLSRRIDPPRATRPDRRSPASRPPDAARTQPMADPETPPMHVIFGMDELVRLVDSLLEPGERLGRVTLRSDTPDPAARRRFVEVASRLAAGAGCEVAVGEHGGTLVVEVYGPRARIGQLAGVLTGGA